MKKETEREMQTETDKQANDRKPDNRYRGICLPKEAEKRVTYNKEKKACVYILTPLFS